MTSLPSIPDGEHDSSRSDTPLASYRFSSTIGLTPTPPSVLISDDQPILSPSVSLPASMDPHTGPLFPPLSALSSAIQVSLTLPVAPQDAAVLDSLPPELASADIFFAPDGAFVETSSGPAARELKKLYDQQLGVGMSVRSPYAITAYVNQHGKEMYRIGHRDMSAPAASSAQVEQLVTQPRSAPARDEQRPSRSKRQSRMSMHAFLPPSMFKTGSSLSRPVTTGPPSRKLRKTRSIPDMSEYTFGAASSTGPSTRNIGSRAHAHSVTGADVSVFPMPSTEAPRSPTRIGDMFSDVMGWENPLTTRNIFFSQEVKTPAFVMHPFGSGVSFDSPARPAINSLPAPSQALRVMHSFESGLTARQVDSQVDISEDTPAISEKSTSRTPSMSSVKEVPSVPPQSARNSSHADGGYMLLPETSNLSRYSMDVFDVLQTYRGLPRLDKLSPGSAETTVIKMSLAAYDLAAPKDDPRFVIWGEIDSEPDPDDLSISQGSLTDLSSSMHSSASRKRSIRSQTHESPSVRLASGMQKVVVAATIERWIAQLTSEFNYDELLNFFLTYRTYIPAVDLGHLLICRFHWALGRPLSSQDERVRRIVRVRTFVAIRYWLVTFFAEDFIPNRELRLLVADWLNALARDPILKTHVDGLSIVRKLKKVVKDCKETHSPSHVKTIAKSRPPKAQKKTTHVLGEKFAEAIASQESDSDVDLDFLPDEVSSVAHTSGGYAGDLHNAHLTSPHVGTVLSPTNFPLAAFSILPQSPPTSTETETPPTPLPVRHNPISRAFVNTIGKLGRWKRVLNARSTVRPPLTPCAGLSAFDLDVAGAENLLAIDNEVEQYLKMVERQTSTPVEDSADGERPSLSLSVPPTVGGSNALTIGRSSVDFSDVIIIGPENSEPSIVQTDPEDPEVANVTTALDSKLLPPIPAETESDLDGRSNATSLSIRSNSTDSLGRPLSPKSRTLDIRAPEPSPWQFDVVSIDDLDLSDTSSILDPGSPSAPPGLRRGPRKLPLRKDFEFVRTSESEASTGINSHDSMVSTGTSSIISTSSAGGGLGGTIQPWQVTALVDSLSDDEENGDVEAALRRLEGQINPKKEQEKASKVDGWVRAIQARLAAGDHNHEDPSFSSDEEDEIEQNFVDDSEEGQSPEEVGEQFQEVVIDGSGPHNSLAVVDGEQAQMATTPLASQTTHRISTPTLTSLSNVPTSKPTNQDIKTPVEFQPRSSTGLSFSDPKRLSVSQGFGDSDIPRTHRSFILGFRAETLVEHFSMIDRELFLSIKFGELVSPDWASCEEVNILDWSQYLKDRARWKSESIWPQKTTNLATIRARFNLIANFTLSEVVLTQPTERAAVVNKFIRVAWKAYSLRNFHTLVAVIAGLGSEWVTRAMRRSWNRVGVWETRMYKDLRQFTSSGDDFQHIRRTIDAMADVGSRAGSMVSSAPTDSGGKTILNAKAPARSCVPFIGVYLSQLHSINQLPDLIDPTAPNEAVRIDPVTSNFDPPAHPEVFASLQSLPPSMQLEPLINVQKQRLIAGVVQSLVAGQHHASRVQFPVDKKIFQKCLRLRALDSDTLHRVLARYSD